MDNEILAQFLDILRSAIGVVPYLFGTSQQVTEDVSGGVNCSGLFNWARTQMGLGLPPNFSPEDGILLSGLGTMGYARFLEDRMDFDPNLLYQVGTILINDDVRFDEDWNQVRDFSHIAIVSTLPDENENQFLIQSDHVGGITQFDANGNPLLGVPGVNEDRTITDTIQAIYFDDPDNDNLLAKEKGFFWAGVMPDIGLEPWPA